MDNVGKRLDMNLWMYAGKGIPTLAKRISDGALLEVHRVNGDMIEVSYFGAVDDNGLTGTWNMRSDGLTVTSLSARANKALGVAWDISQAINDNIEADPDDAECELKMRNAEAQYQALGEALSAASAALAKYRNSAEYRNRVAMEVS